MILKDILLAIGIALAWAFNLVVIRFALTEVTPFVFGFLRFLFTVFPLIFFIPKPNISWPKLILMGCVIGVLNFALLFRGMSAGLSVGMVALTLQLQVVFTAIIGVALYRDRLKFNQIAGIALAFIGVALIGWQHSMEGNNTIWGFVLVLGSALSWGLGNNLSRSLKNVNILHFTIWMSLVPPIPYLILSYFFEGPDAIVRSYQNAGMITVWTTLYIVVVATIFALTKWTALIFKYSPPQIAIYGLLIPVFSMALGSIFFDESLNTVGWVASVCVLLGLIINQWEAFTQKSNRSLVEIKSSQKAA